MVGAATRLVGHNGWMSIGFRYWIGASLASPPGYCTSNESAAALYRAALSQPEQLLDAAAATGYAARPLPLFYAAAQAGQAIGACRGAEPARKHGLQVDDAKIDPADPLAAQIQPKRSGEFPSVAEAIGSPPLAGPAAIGQLMRSLPELARPFADVRWHPARYVDLVATPTGPDLGFGSVLPAAAVAVGPDEDPKAVAASLQSAYGGSVGGEWQVVPGWRTDTIAGPAVVLRSGPQARRAARPLDTLTPEYRWVGRRWLRPDVGTAAPPKPLMTWWALLFGLSVLARYHPTVWAAALDRHSCTAAVEFERALDVALDALPHLVLEAIADWAVLLAPGSSTPPFAL